MGSVATITADQFPRQGEMLNRRTKVIFHYGGPELMGTIVRDDIEHPFRTIIHLDDGRFIMSSECQYAPEVA